MSQHNLLSLHELTQTDVMELLARADRLKERQKSGMGPRPLVGKTLGLIFEKSSTRTRVSFEAAMNQLGGAALFLSVSDLQIQRGETIADTARVLSRFLDALVIRTFGQELLEEWARESDVPVINGLTDLHHPCQALGDLLTIRERLKELKGIKMAYIGDGNNMAHSLIEGASKTGMRIDLACPPGHEPEEEIIASAKEEAKKSGGEINLMESPAEAAKNADVIYTDVWVSMGQEKSEKTRIKKFQPYQVNKTLVDLAKDTAIVMHCLPAHREMEITSEILDGPRAVIWDQAENRLHIQKSILEWLLTS